MPIFRSGVSVKRRSVSRIDDVIYQRNEKEDKDWIRRLHLRGKQGHAEPIEIQFCA